MDKPAWLKLHERAHADFVLLVSSMTPEQFSRRGGGWAPRDVVAHLIGSNRNIRIGCQDIVTGRIPFYHKDAPNDYRRCNAEFTAQNRSTNADVLLGELAEASGALRVYLGGMSEEDWKRDHGPNHYRGGPASIDRCAESITQEYVEHGREIAAGLGPPAADR